MKNIKISANDLLVQKKLKNLKRNYSVNKSQLEDFKLAFLGATPTSEANKFLNQQTMVASKKTAAKKAAPKKAAPKKAAVKKAVVKKSCAQKSNFSKASARLAN